MGVAIRRSGPRRERIAGLGARPRVWRQLGQSEIAQLRVTTVGDEHIGRLDVAVDDLLGVRGVEGVCELRAELE